MAVPTHYQRLGVTPSASTEEIRAAYRQLARRLHPDHLGDSSGAERAHAERRMREINESWEVLRDPARRRRYDEARQSGARRPATARPAPASRAVTTIDDDLVDVVTDVGGLGAGVLRHGPWLVMVLVLGLIFVATAYAGANRAEAPKPQQPGADVVAGSCIDTGAGAAVTVVPCTGPYEFEVVAVVPTADACPEGTEARRFSNLGSWDCVRPPSSP